MHSTTAIDIFDSLSRIMRAQPSHFDLGNKTEIESLFSYCAEGMDDDSQKLLATLLIKALNKKIRSEKIGENIYLNKYEISQIELFNILIEKFPFVKFSQQITNRAMMELIGQHPEITIVDIGIGQGTQMLHLIESVRHMKQLKKIHVVGIEPYEEALRRAEKAILSIRSEVPFDIEFTGIHDFAERVDFSALKDLNGPIVVNASLALHHIQSELQRQETIARIKKINPVAFLLIEPNVNHFETDFYTRFLNCYHHFYSIFQVIDRIDISQNDKNALKLFFGREIEDIIGKDEEDRYEKHEPATHWLERLRANQFNIRNEWPDAPHEIVGDVAITTRKEGYLGFSFGTETVLAVIYAN